MDSDKDGFGDNRDEYPYDNSEWDDSDGDGVGDNEDAFPDDPTETKDSDGDGIGDNSDSSPFPTTDGGMGKKIEDNFTIILLVLGLSIPLTAIALIMARKDSEEFQEDPIEEYYDEGQWSEKSRLIDTIEDLKRSGRGSFYVSDWADLGRMQLTSSGLPSIDTQPSERFSKEALEASNFDAMEQAASSTREALDWLMIHAVVSATESEEKLEQLNKGKEIIVKDGGEKKFLSTLGLLSIKPKIIVCNVDEESLVKGNSFTNEVKKKYSGDKIVTICADIEDQIMDLDNNERETFMKEIGLNKTGLNQLIKEGYELLNLDTFFTSGPEESRAWTVEKNTLAPKAASVIHTDFEKNFIRAEAVTCEDFIKFGSAEKCKENGKLRIEGKDYIVKDGDVLYFRVNP